MLVLASLVMVGVSNNSAGALAQPAIAAAFEAGPADVGWVVFGFGAAFAVSTAIWGGVARRFGLGPSIATGVTLVVVGSVAAMIAPSLPLLIAARIVQGSGAGAIPTLAASLIARRFDGHARVRALGSVVAGVGLGLAAGPILGGIALELFGWRGPVAIGILVAPAALLLAREDRARDRNVRLDLLGAVLVAVAVAAVTFVLNRVPVSGLSVPTVAAVAALAVTVPLLVRRSTAGSSFVPRRIVTDPAFLRLAPVGAVGMSAFLGTIVLAPVAGARAHGLAGISLGLLILPLAVGAAVSAFNNGRVQARIGRRSTSLTALLLLSVGAGAAGLLGAATAPPVMAMTLVPVGVGFGLLQAPLLNELTTSFGDADRPAAVGLYNLTFILGGSSGGALATALVQSEIELPIFVGRSVPGFSTAELLVAAAPLVALAVLLVRRGRGPTGPTPAEHVAAAIHEDARRARGAGRSP